MWGLYHCPSECLFVSFWLPYCFCNTMWMWHMGTQFSGGRGSADLTVGLDVVEVSSDLNDSMILWHWRSVLLAWWCSRRTWRAFVSTEAAGEFCRLEGPRPYPVLSVQLVGSGGWHRLSLKALLGSGSERDLHCSHTTGVQGIVSEHKADQRAVLRTGPCSL